MALTDKSIMNFGKHKGKCLADVPADYLKWLYEEGKCYPDLRKYIEDNLDAINIEIKRKNN